MNEKSYNHLFEKNIISFLSLFIIIIVSAVISEHIVEYFHAYRGVCYPIFPHPIIGWSKSLITSSLVVIIIIVFLEKKLKIYFHFKEIFFVIFIIFFSSFILKWMFIYSMSLDVIYLAFYSVFLSKDAVFFYINLGVLLWVFKNSKKEVDKK